jgi:hypothetical protein
MASLHGDCAYFSGLGICMVDVAECLLEIRTLIKSFTTDIWSYNYAVDTITNKVHHSGIFAN